MVFLFYEIINIEFTYTMYSYSMLERRLNMRNKLKKLFRDVKNEIREHKSSFFIYLLLRLLVIIMMILQMFNKNYENVFFCLLTLLLLTIPSFLQVTFKVELPTTLEIIILLFLFIAVILGDVSRFYMIFPYFDTLLHTCNGFLAAAVGFSLVDLLNNNDKIQFHLSPIFVVIVAFCFSMTIGILWEFFEYFMDLIFYTDMQKDTIIHTISSVELMPYFNGGIINHINTTSVNGMNLNLNGYLDIGLIDTMNDLIVNFIGAFVFSFFGYFYSKNNHNFKNIK